MPPLVLVAAAWAAGLVLAHHLLAPAGVEPGALLIVGTVPLAALLLWRQDRSLRLSSICALALIAAALRYQAALPEWNDPAFVAHYNGVGRVTVEGVVRGYPDRRDTWTNLRLDAESLDAGGQSHPVHGIVLVRAPRLPEAGYGDHLRVSGLLQAPPELPGFSYEDYLARHGIYSYIGQPRIELIAQGQGSPVKAAVLAVKDQARAVIARLVPEPQASLLQGIVLGTRASVSRDLYDLFNTTGTSHIIVISGANLIIIATLLARTSGRLLGQRRGFWLTLSGVALYVLLVGAEPAVARAGVMAGLFLTARYLGRRATAYVSLCAAGLLLTMSNPFVLWNVGFQLSFAATLSLILFAPPIERLFERGLAGILPQERARVLTRYVNDLLIVTLAAQILIIPLVLFHFGRMSLVAPLANLLIGPVQPPIIVVGGLATLVGLVPFLAPLAQALLWIPWLGLAYTTAIVRWMATWPLASLQVGPDRAARLALYYGLVLAVVWALGQGLDRRLWSWLATRRSRPPASIMLGAPLAVVILIWLAVWQLPDGRLHVAFLDVGEGDAIFITTPLGQQILVDGGPNPASLTSALGRQLPFWDRSIDLVVMSHADADHITGLTEVLKRYEVDTWLDNGHQGDDAIYEECDRLLEQDKVSRYAVRAGDGIDLGRGVILEVLNPTGTGARDNANDDSVVLRLSWDQAGVLLTGDIGFQAERSLLQTGRSLSAGVLKVAHHGSDSSSGVRFLTTVAPRFAVISAGADNRFGHPAPALLDRLARLGAVILRTDQSGTVELISDGRQWWVKTER